MKYEEIILPESSTINDYIDNENREHMKDMRRQHARVLGITESYNPEIIGSDAPDDVCFLTDKGYLYVKIDDNKYHEYDLFKVNTSPNSPKYNTVYFIGEPPTYPSVNFENTHRLVLTKRSNNVYWVEPISCGSMGDDRLYRLDMDGYLYMGTVTLPDLSDGYFKNINTQNGSGTNYIVISAKQFLYIKTEPNAGDAHLTINVYNPITGVTNNLFKYANEPYYFISQYNDNEHMENSGITIINNDEASVDDFIFLSITGTEQSPNQIILEVY